MRYSSRDIVHLTGITYRQFQRWRERGLIPPAEGRGRNSHFTQAHLDRVREIVATIVDGRVTLADLEERFLYDTHPELLDDGDVA